MGSETLLQCTLGKILAQARLPRPLKGLVPIAAVEFADCCHFRQAGVGHVMVGDGGAGDDSAALSRIQLRAGAIPHKI